MIASVRGSALHVGLDRVVVEVGGVGMLVHTTPGTASSVRRGHEAALATTLVVREDSLTLYGFANDDERDMFEQVQTVSGVGPRLALAMLSVMAPDRIRAAISGSDIAALTKVPGIGKKGAERMVLELRDKIGVPTSAVAGAARSPRPARSGATRSPRPSSVWLDLQAGRGRRQPGGCHRGREPQRLRDAARGSARAGALGHGRRFSPRRSTRTARSTRRRASSMPAVTPTTGPSRRPCGHDASARSRGSRGCATSSGWCSRLPSAEGARPTTCSCPGHQGSGRPPWR